ncbi:MAG: DUF421 domain-containing protein [Firmicutes bacterium]|nr:DUF421 domain-containing protein [Bacillota bacterium]
MTYTDFVIGVTIGTIAGAFVVNSVRGLWVLLSPVFFAVATLLLSLITYKSLNLRKMLQGEPVVIIQNGKILEKNMKKVRFHIDLLEMELRNQGVFDITEVEFAVLETHGQLSVLKKSQNLPVTKRDIGKSTQYKGMATEIIKDGVILEQNLSQNNLSFGWLYNELRKRKVKDVKDVVYAALQTDGSLYTDIEEDDLKYVQEIEDKR